MNWAEAVEAMKAGAHVQRKIAQYRMLISNKDGIPVYECGTEPMKLAHAWTAEERPGLVFQGAESRVLFIPDFEDRQATDWEVVWKPGS